MPTIDEIKAAAEVLDALFDEDAGNEIAYGTTYFGHTAKQLRELSDKRAVKSRKVFIDEYQDGSNDVIVYIERHDGQFVGAYVGEAWDGVAVHESLRASIPVGQQVWGPTK
ncbi:hypothetical protein [Mycobacteroides abscessus]|uniref:hypothetical protein n=1 Tax=Mycobacteroides abscessus TaxID=36809 RepID=UPI000C25D8A3|nr:hypothetical protein [Mycobacteroides abscessus]